MKSLGWGRHLKCGPTYRHAIWKEIKNEQSAYCGILLLKNKKYDHTAYGWNTLHKSFRLKLNFNPTVTNTNQSPILSKFPSYTIIWAPSSEFVSSSIPSLQILTAHAQPFRGARDLAFCLKVPLDSLLVWASSGGSGETAWMLIWSNYDHHRRFSAILETT